ncbi:SMI1/KNR4 family protein [Pseudomonas syringae]|nr:SMI1/KNR4 family protein [Pseudomonas syringae]
MLPYLIESAASLSKADIHSFEQRLEGRLPEAFRDFYLAINGGYIDDALNGNDLLLAGFVPIKYGRVPMEQAYSELVEDVPALVGKIPFAFDEGGNYFLLSLGDADHGTIGLWIMDTGQYHEVAHDFPAFLDRLAG